MPSKRLSKIIAAGGGTLLFVGFAAFASLEPAITNAASVGFKGSQGFWLGWTDYGLIFVIVGGLFTMLYGLLSWQSESSKISLPRDRLRDAAAAA